MAKRTTLRLAGVEAEVSLVPGTRKMREAQYEVRREYDDGPAAREAVAAHIAVDPFGDPEHTQAVRLADDLAVAPERPAAPSGGRVRHGVTGPDDQWVDLTERLAAIDRECLVDGMEVLFTMALRGVPRLLVKDVHHLVPVGPAAHDVLRRVWVGLNGAADEDLVAVVRWTKRTNQTLGVVQPSMAVVGGSSAPVLRVLEMHWPETLTEAPPAAALDVDAVPEGGVASAMELVRALRGRPSEVWRLRDERMARRAELLEAAREGHEWSAPEQAAREHVPEADVFAAALAGR
jgi:hypothetical protein